MGMKFQYKSQGKFFFELNLAKIINKSISQQRNVAYFRHLLDVFNVLLNFFYDKEVPPQKSG